jgi:hypothetical protein
MGPDLFSSLSIGVYCYLLGLRQWRMHLRQEPADITSDFRVSFAFEDIVNDIPALLHFATGCDESRLTRLRLIAVATNIRSKLRLDVGGRVALIRAKNVICLWNS